MTRGSEWKKGKYFVGVLVTRASGGRVEDHTETSCSVLIGQFWRRKGTSSLHPNLCLIQEVGGWKANQIKRSSKRYQTNGLLQHLCKRAIVSWLHFHFHYKTAEDSRIVTFKTAEIPEFLSHFPNVQAERRNKRSPIISLNFPKVWLMSGSKKPQSCGCDATALKRYHQRYQSLTLI